MDSAALGHDEVQHSAKAPTCTEVGWNEYVACSRCEDSTYVEIEALGHDEVQHEAKAPTCTEIGWDAYVTCTRCNYSTYVDSAALGHSYSDWNILVLPDESGDGFKSRVCTVCSEEEFGFILYASGDLDGDGTLTNADVALAVRAMSGWATDGDIALADSNYDGKITNRDIIGLIRKLAGWDHVWTEATCQAPKTCSVCKLTEGSAIDHVQGENGKCKSCGQVFVVSMTNLTKRTYTLTKMKKTEYEGSLIDCVTITEINLINNVIVNSGDYLDGNYVRDDYADLDQDMIDELRIYYGGKDYWYWTGGFSGSMEYQITNNQIVWKTSSRELTLELLSDGTLKVVSASGFGWNISAGDIFV